MSTQPGSNVVTPRTGVWMFPDRSARELVELIVSAESAGLDEFWVGDEGPAREPFSVLAAAGARTSQISLAVGITNPYVRAPALAATTALTIHELSNGRMILGVGAGGQLSLGPLNLRPTTPIAQVRSFIETTRAVAAGIPGPSYEPTDFSITEADCSAHMAVYVGARSERLNRLASEVADGAFVAGLPPFRYSQVIGWARSIRDIQIALYPGVAFTAEAVERQRPQMIWGLTDTADIVRERLGLDTDKVSAAASALAGGDDRLAREVVSDDIVPELILTGAPASVGAGLAALVREHGPDSIGLALTPMEPGADLAAAVEALSIMKSELGGN